MNAVDSICVWLNDAGIPFEREGETLTIQAYDPGGFEVRIGPEKGGFVVWAEGWHEHDFESARLLDFVKIALSRNSRLVVLSRGKERYAFSFELLQNDQWNVFSRTYYINLAFWRRRKVTVLQNSWI